MPKTSINVGIFLIALGIGFYFFTGAPTALIATGFGALFLILGLIARKSDSARKHSMHVAALVSLLGIIGGLGMGGVGLSKLISGAEGAQTAAVVEQLIMGSVCLVFLILCIRSFRAARLAAG